MALLSWGKPKIRITKIGDESAQPIVIPTPVEGTTALNTTKGNKVDAPLEGGGYEDIKYNKNTYSFEFELYASKGREKPVEDTDGIINGLYKIELQPEDPTTQGIVIDKAVLSVEETYSAEIGIKWKYTADVLVPDDESAQVKMQVVSFS